MNELEMSLLKLWADNGVKEIYKYKHRIQEYREHLGTMDLFHDITCGSLFADVEDIANHRDSLPVDYKVDIKTLIYNRNVNAAWKQSETGSYFSHHILVSYLGDQEPKYHVLNNPDGDGWVIGEFYTFTGEYVPLEEEGEERLVFPTAAEALQYVDVELKKVKKKLKEQLHKENANRWIGKAKYNCLNCSHSMSTENNELMCVVNSVHKKVEKNHLCKQWI